MDCNFDKDECGFRQDKNDKLDWTRRKGSTPSTNTGPSGDHGSGSGEWGIRFLEKIDNNQQELFE